MTVTQIRQTRAPARPAAASAALTPGALLDATDALADAEALVTTAMRALGAEGDSPEAVTLGFALAKLRATTEHLSAMRAPATQD